MKMTHVNQPNILPALKDEKAFRIALAQLHTSDRPEENLARGLAAIEASAELHADLVCLPELFAIPYPCQAEDYEQFKLAEAIPGPTTEILSVAARRARVAVVTTIFERRAAGLFHNTAVVIDAGGQLVGCYRKCHVPDDPLYYEKFYFTPGDSGYPVHDLGKMLVGIGICWDQWFPEQARLLALNGAELILYPTTIGWYPGDKQTCGTQQQLGWELVMRSHAIVNGVFVAAVNRAGWQGPTEYWGSSFACDPGGNVLARASVAEADLLIADCPLSAIEETRQLWPFFRDRRVDTYDGLLQRWNSQPSQGTW